MKPEPLPPPAPDLAKSLLGIWRLVSREDYAADGRRLIDPALGADPLGIVSFAPSYFAAQFMNRNRSAPSAGGAIGGAADRSASAAAAANNSSAIDGYDAYFGSYTCDAEAGRIATRLEGGISRANIGSVFTRDIRVIGDRLLIRLATNAADGTPVTRTLTFERLS
ncbi:MAG TPA: lipocalin-like domain-containing protein [Candidatus Eisenbacteria bacterium]